MTSWRPQSALVRQREVGRAQPATISRGLGPCAVGLGGWTLSGLGNLATKAAWLLPGAAHAAAPPKRFTCRLCRLQSTGRAASRMVLSCPRAALRRRYRFLEAGKGVTRSPNKSSKPSHECKNCTNAALQYLKEALGKGQDTLKEHANQ